MTMSLSTHRALLRRLQWHRIAVRNASTATQVSNVASQATSKASQGLSRVSDSAGTAASRATSAATSAVGTITETTGKIVNFAQSLVPPTLYYAKVGLELGKLVAHNRKMSPPDVATFQSYFQNMLSSVRSPAASLNQASSTVTSKAQGMSPATIIKNMQNMDNQQMINVGVIAAEAIGFFTVGEMIGRLKLIGYSSKTHGHGEHH